MLTEFRYEIVNIQPLSAQYIFNNPFIVLLHTLDSFTLGITTCPFSSTHPAGCPAGTPGQIFDSTRSLYASTDRRIPVCVRFGDRVCDVFRSVAVSTQNSHRPSWRFCLCARTHIGIVSTRDGSGRRLYRTGSASHERQRARVSS